MDHFEVVDYGKKKPLFIPHCNHCPEEIGEFKDDMEAIKAGVSHVERKHPDVKWEDE